MVSKKTANMCSNWLVIVAFMLAMLSMLIANCGKQIDENETLMILGYPKKIGVLKWFLIGTMIMGFIFSILLKLRTDKMMSRFNMGFLAFSFIAFFMVNNKMMLIQGLSADIVEENCDILQEKRKVGSADMYMKEVFDYVALADMAVAAQLNTQMCTARCPCQGDEDSVQYDQYMRKALESNLNAKGRTKVGSRYQGKEDLSDFVWNHNSGYKSFMACLDQGKEKEFEGQIESESVQTVEYKMDWIKDTIKYLTAVTKVDIPAEKKMQLAYIESTYNCSGFCTPPLFYITQSIERGVPESGCFLPLIKDIDHYLNGMRILIKLSMVIILVMMFSTYIIMKQAIEEEEVQLIQSSTPGDYRKSKTSTFVKSQTRTTVTNSPSPAPRR